MTKADTMKPTIFVVDDDPKIRDALQWLFESIHLNVVLFESALAFLEPYDEHRRGCLIIDVRMPGMSGLELLEHLKIKKNTLPVIVITGHGDIPMAVRAMKAGAIDFILKPFNDQYLLEQIQKALVHDLRQPVSATNEPLNACFASLTAREHDVMALVVSGKLNKQIASELGIVIWLFRQLCG